MKPTYNELAKAAQACRQAQRAYHATAGTGINKHSALVAARDHERHLDTLLKRIAEEDARALFDAEQPEP